MSLTCYSVKKLLKSSAEPMIEHLTPFFDWNYDLDFYVLSICSFLAPMSHLALLGLASLGECPKRTRIEIWEYPSKTLRDLCLHLGHRFLGWKALSFQGQSQTICSRHIQIFSKWRWHGTEAAREPSLGRDCSTLWKPFLLFFWPPHSNLRLQFLNILKYLGQTFLAATWDRITIL